MKVCQPYDEIRYVPWIGREVAPGEVVTVPDADLASYLEAGWEAADKATERAAAALRKAGTVTVGAEPEPEPEPAAEPAENDVPAQPEKED